MSAAATLHTLGEILAVQATERGENVALVQDGIELTYAELERRARKIAGALVEAGVRRGDRVAWLGRNDLAYFEYLFGAAKAGAVMVPMNWRLAPPEIEYLCHDARPRCVVAGAEFASVAEHCAPSALHRVVGGIADTYAAWRDAAHPLEARTYPADDAALQLYTSGTTGRPKGAVLTHRNLFELRRAMSPAIRPDWYHWTPKQVSLIAMPISHVSGTGWALWSLQHGAKAIVTREFDPHAVLDLIATHRITRILMVPTAIEILVRHPRAKTTDLSCLECIFYGGSPMPPDLLRDAMNVLRCQFVQLYGMTETNGAIVALPPEDHRLDRPERMRSVGRPLPGVELRIVDSSGAALPTGESGEIMTRSAANMAGYFLQPHATKEAVEPNGWLHTGDAGYVDVDGYIYLRDRIKDLIITGGENVYPVEVELALREHPRVADVAVIGLPDTKWGEIVAAFIVATAGPTPDAKEIMAWARERIGGFKVPKRVEFIADLPRNASGKVLRRELRDSHHAAARM